MQFGDTIHSVNALHSSTLWTSMETHLTGITLIRVNKSGSVGQFVVFLTHGNFKGAETLGLRLTAESQITLEY